MFAAFVVGEGEGAFVGFQMDVDGSAVLSVGAGELEFVVRGVADGKVSIKRAMGTAEFHETQEALDDGFLNVLIDFFDAVVVAVDVTSVAGEFDEVRIVFSGEQADIVDLRDAGCEELDGTGGDVGVVVAVERGVVGAVDLIDVEVLVFGA